MIPGFEKRREILYKDVEDLIQYGYLTANVDVNGCNLAMRSICLGDPRLFMARVGISSDERTWREWVVASTVWMVEGYDLNHVPNAAVEVRRSLQETPSYAVEKLYSLFTQLYARLTRAIEATEAFCYEDYSRTLWRMTNRGQGKTVNAVQHVWTAFNIAEDEKELWDREWIAARFIASAHNPKGVKKIAQRDEMNQNLEKERRQHVVASLYKKITNQSLVEDENGNVYITARSKEELEDEMQRWLKGEKDWHDQVIDAYKDAIRQQHENQRAQHEARMGGLQEANEEGVVGGVTAAGLTPEQLQEFLAQKGQGAKTTSTIVDLSSSHVYEKYLSQEIQVGGLSDTGKAVPISQPTQVGERKVTWRDE